MWCIWNSGVWYNKDLCGPGGSNLRHPGFIQAVIALTSLSESGTESSYTAGAKENLQLFLRIFIINVSWKDQYTMACATRRKIHFYVTSSWKTCWNLDYFYFKPLINIWAAQLSWLSVAANWGCKPPLFAQSSSWHAAQANEKNNRSFTIIFFLSGAGWKQS